MAQDASYQLRPAFVLLPSAAAPGGGTLRRKAIMGAVTRLIHNGSGPAPSQRRWRNRVTAVATLMLVAWLMASTQLSVYRGIHLHDLFRMTDPPEPRVLHANATCSEVGGEADARAGCDVGAAASTQRLWRRTRAGSRVPFSLGPISGSIPYLPPPSLNKQVLGVDKVALMFLTKGPMHHERTWRVWLEAAAGLLPRQALLDTQVRPRAGRAGGAQRGERVRIYRRASCKLCSQRYAALVCRGRRARRRHGS